MRRHKTNLQRQWAKPGLQDVGNVRAENKMFQLPQQEPCQAPRQPVQQTDKALGLPQTQGHDLSSEW